MAITVNRVVRSAAIVVLLLQSLPAAGQTAGSLDGTVTDRSNGPLPGVSLEARSPSLQAYRAGISDSAGRFHLPSLPPGIYTVSAALPGFVAVESTGVRVALAETTTLPLTMKMELSAELVVTAETPVLDVTSSTGGQNIRYEVIRNFPVSRNYADILRISPGVATDRAETQGRATPFTIYGATSLENQYLVDGANTTNVIKGFQGKALPNEFVEEVQIKSSGYEAEYGGALGGIVNVITKSGSNEIHGDVFGYFGSRSLTASPKARGATDSVYVDRSSEDRRDYGLDLGGPLLKDRLWFFGAYNRVDLDQDQVVLADTTWPTQGQNFPIAYSTNLFSGKLTLRASDSTTFVGTVFGDPESREGSLRNFSAPQPTTRVGIRDVGGADTTLSLMQLLGGKGFANVRYAHHRDSYELTPVTNTPLFVDTTVFPSVASGGFGFVGGATDNNTSVRDAWKLDGTLFAGAHELKGGAEYERTRTDAMRYYSGGQTVTKRPCPTSGPRRCPAGQTVYYQHNFQTGSLTDPVGAHIPGVRTQRPRTNRLAIFAQDTFKPLPSLTINAGLRYGQDDVLDYTGTRVFRLTDEWQPRIGVAWDVLKDGRSRASASYGRFYYALPTALTVYAYGGYIDASTYNFSPTALEHDPAAPRSQAVFGSVQSEPVQDGLKGIYQDELTLGFDRSFTPSLSVGIRYTYRNLGNTIEDRCDLDPGYPEARDNYCVIFNPGSSSPFSTGQGIHGCDGRYELGIEGNPDESACDSPALYPIPAMPAAERRYQGIELVARTQVQNALFLQASYVYSRLTGNYDGAASSSQGTGLLNGTYTSQSIPGWAPDFDYPYAMVNADGNLTLDRPHSFRLDASYTTPFGLTTAFQGYLRSGAPISRQEAQGYYGVYMTPRGSEGRQPWDYEISLQLQYAFRVSAATVTTFVQGFNLLNRQTVFDTDQLTTYAPPTEPNYVNPNYGKTTGRRDPRSFRLGARVSF